jgi:hypothetical protein
MTSYQTPTALAEGKARSASSNAVSDGAVKLARDLHQVGYSAYKVTLTFKQSREDLLEVPHSIHYGKPHQYGASKWFDPKAILHAQALVDRLINSKPVAPRLLFHDDPLSIRSAGNAALPSAIAARANGELTTHGRPPLEVQAIKCLRIETTVLKVYDELCRRVVNQRRSNKPTNTLRKPLFRYSLELFPKYKVQSFIDPVHLHGALFVRDEAVHRKLLEFVGNDTLLQLHSQLQSSEIAPCNPEWLRYASKERHPIVRQFQGILPDEYIHGKDKFLQPIDQHQGYCNDQHRLAA